MDNHVCCIAIFVWSRHHAFAHIYKYASLHLTRQHNTRLTRLRTSHYMHLYNATLSRLHNAVTRLHTALDASAYRVWRVCIPYVTRLAFGIPHI